MSNPEQLNVKAAEQEETLPEKIEEGEKREWGAEEERKEEERKERVLGFGEIRKKLEEFKQAREELVKAEKSGKGVEEAREKYEKMRVEYVGEKLWRQLSEQERMTETKAEKFKGLFRKVYEWSSDRYLIPKNWVKKMEEWQPSSLVPENLIKKIEDWQPESRIGKAGKFSADIAAKLASLKTLANLGIKLTSVRNMASYGLLGLGVAAGATGVGAGAAVGAIALRRGLAGMGTGFGMYNTLNRIVDWKEGKKDIYQELNKQELNELAQKEIIDRLEYFEAKARVRGQKVKELKDYQNYRNLKLELNGRFKEKFEGVEDEKAESRPGAIKSWLTKNRNQIEDKLSAHYDKEKAKDKRIKLMAIGAGAFTAVGGIRIVGKGIVDMIRGEGASGFGKAGLQEYNTYKTLFFGKEGPIRTEELVEKPKVTSTVTPKSPEAVPVPVKETIVFGKTPSEFKPAPVDSTTSAVADSTRPKI